MESSQKLKKAIDEIEISARLDSTIASAIERARSEQSASFRQLTNLKKISIAAAAGLAVCVGIGGAGYYISNKLVPQANNNAAYVAETNMATYEGGAAVARFSMGDNDSAETPVSSPQPSDETGFLQAAGTSPNTSAEEASPSAFASAEVQYRIQLTLPEDFEEADIEKQLKETTATLQAEVKDLILEIADIKSSDTRTAASLIVTLPEGKTKPDLKQILEKLGIPFTIEAVTAVQD